jgi:hypothetical protein
MVIIMVFSLDIFIVSLKEVDIILDVDSCQIRMEGYLLHGAFWIMPENGQFLNVYIFLGYNTVLCQF